MWVALCKRSKSGEHVKHFPSTLPSCLQALCCARSVDPCGAPCKGSCRELGQTPANFTIPKPDIRNPQVKHCKLEQKKKRNKRQWFTHGFFANKSDCCVSLTGGKGALLRAFWGAGSEMRAKRGLSRANSSSRVVLSAFQAKPTGQRRQTGKPTETTTAAACRT